MRTVVPWPGRAVRVSDPPSSVSRCSSTRSPSRPSVSGRCGRGRSRCRRRQCAVARRRRPGGRVSMDRSTSTRVACACSATLANASCAPWYRACTRSSVSSGSGSKVVRTSMPCWRSGPARLVMAAGSPAESDRADRDRPSAGAAIAAPVAGIAAPAASSAVPAPAPRGRPRRARSPLRRCPGSGRRAGWRRPGCGPCRCPGRRVRQPASLRAAPANPPDQRSDGQLDDQQQQQAPARAEETAGTTDRRPRPPRG